MSEPGCSRSDSPELAAMLHGHEGMLEMINLISDLQSDRMNNQRAELRPVPKTPKDSKGASLPGMAATATTSMKPEEDFLEIIARVQGSRLEDQRTELPRLAPEVHVIAPAPEPQAEAQAAAQPAAQAQAQAPAQAESQAQAQASAQPAADREAEDAFFNQLMRAQGSRLEDQRATMGPSRASTSKK